MSLSPPPVAHTGKKPPTAAAALGTTEAADLMEGTAPSIDYAASNTTTDVSSSSDKTFVEKIHALLIVPDYSSIISWNDPGTVVIIHDVDAFISTIMPVHFRYSQFGSFTRRMRRWGFRVKQRSSSSKSSTLSSERGQSNELEFSSKHFLRDQPDLCLLMKDERQVKKKYTFLDRTVRKVGGGAEHGTQGSSAGVCVHYPPSLSSRGGTVMPSSEYKPGGSMTPPSAENLPIPVHYPPSSSLSHMSTSKNQPDSQSEVPQSSTMLKSTGDDDLNVAMNVGYPQNYSQETSMPPMISPNVHSFHSSMPMMNNMMMSAQPPPLHYPPYGYGAPPPGLDFGPPFPGFPYPAPYVYPPYPQQQQQQQHQQQQHMMQLNQYPPPPEFLANPTAASVLRKADAKAATPNVVLMSSLSESSSYELPPEFDLLPTKTNPNVRNQSQLDTEQKDGQVSREREEEKE